jgi:hypothetical protein
MADESRKRDSIEDGPSHDGLARRGFLKCMAWAGTGLVWTLSGGIPTSRLFGATNHEGHHDAGFSFVQISDSTSVSTRKRIRTCRQPCKLPSTRSIHSPLSRT